MKMNTIILSLVLCVHMAFGIGSFVRANEKPSAGCFIIVFVSIPILLLIGCGIYLIIIIKTLNNNNKITLFQWFKIIKNSSIIYLRNIPRLTESMTKLFKYTISERGLKWDKH